MSRVTVLYKNAARIGSYVACPLKYAAGRGAEETCDARSAVETYRAYDCLRPCDAEDGGAVIPCKMQVHVCDARGVPCAEAAAHVAPDILVRTDRGAWSAFHAHSVVLLPSEGSALALHVATKERSNVMRAVLCVAFVSLRTGALVAQSEPLLVLSKPPPSVRQPFARVLPMGDAAELHGVPLDAASRCSPTKWLDGVRQDTHVMVPLPPSSATGSWRVHSLGTYRNAGAAIGVEGMAGAAVANSAVANSAVASSAIASSAVGSKRGRDDSGMPAATKLLRADCGSVSGDAPPRAMLALVGGEAELETYCEAGLTADRVAELASELALLREELASERGKRAAAETERAGLARALRLLVAQPPVVVAALSTAQTTAAP